MTWPEIIGSVFAIVCLVVAAVATFAPLAGFTEEVEDD
jgi:Ca2+/Na+ antiporter